MGHMRAVQELLTLHNYEVLMVDTDAGTDVGQNTLACLGRIKRESGIILAVCSRNYAEVTASRFCSYRQLRFALDNGIEVLPLRVEETYPPEPPWGGDHPHDHEGVGQALVQIKLPPSLVPLDCRDKTALQIARDVAERLSSAKAGLRVRHMPSTSVRARGAHSVVLLLNMLCTVCALLLCVTGPAEAALRAIEGIEQTLTASK